MQRVMILGQPGAGKSTLARALGDATGLPVVHIDRLQWASGWVEVPRAEKLARIRAAISGERWIFEGGNSATYAARLARADTLIWLDLGLWLRMWRVTRRVMRYRGQTRPDLAPGCPERFDVEFYRYIWASRRRSRVRMAEVLAAAPETVAVHHLRRPAEVRKFLEEVVQ